MNDWWEVALLLWSTLLCTEAIQLWPVLLLRCIHCVSMLAAVLYSPVHIVNHHCKAHVMTWLSTYSSCPLQWQ